MALQLMYFFIKMLAIMLSNTTRQSVLRNIKNIKGEQMILV